MSLTYAEFRKRAIRNVIKPMCFINLAICLGGTAKTCIIRKQSLSLAGFAHEALLVLVYPAIMALPALFLCWGLQEPLLVEVAVVISHIARSCALASIHWYWSTMPEVVNLIVTAKLELGMEIAISGIDQVRFAAVRTAWCSSWLDAHDICMLLGTNSPCCVMLFLAASPRCNGCPALPAPTGLGIPRQVVWAQHTACARPWHPELAGYDCAQHSHALPQPACMETAQERSSHSPCSLKAGP